MCKENWSFLDFENNAAKNSLINKKILVVNNLESHKNFVTSAPHTKINRMEISFSKYENSARYDPNFPIVMDHDSGYISHNPESNSDSSLENLPETITNSSSSRPIYLSEDALLEKPEVNVYQGNLSMEIEKENYEETRSLFHSPDVIIPSSVRSQKTIYSGFENDSDSNTSCTSDESVEIPVTEQIFVESVSGKNKPTVSGLNALSNINKMSGIEVLVNDTNVDMVCRVNSNESYDYNETVKDQIKEIIDESSNRLENGENHKVTSLSQENRENCDLSALDNITNTNINENLNKKRLTLIFSKSSEENVYSVKRKYCSLTPDKSTTTEKIDVDLGVNITPTETAQVVLMIEERDNLKNVDVATEEKGSDTENILKNDFVLGESISNKQEVSKEEGSLVLSETDLVNNSSDQSNNANNSSLPMTPEKNYKNSVDPNISPDLFGEEEINNKEMKNDAPNFTYIAQEKYINKKDHKILKRVQNDLKGVIPPHSMTVVQMPIDEMLNRLESNVDYFWTNNCPVQKNANHDNSLNTSNESSVTGEPTSLLVTGNLEEYLHRPFPQILEGRYHGLHYNRSKLSEEFEELCAKYGQRYVGAETQSTCTVFEVNFVSPVKRKQLKQRWPVKSPGRRLSHLAKRRITFSSSNLQAATSSAASSRARQILVDARKLDLLNRRRSPRKSPRKTPRKSPRVKTRTPSSSAKKKLALRFRALTGEIENTSASSNNLVLASKRALFRSPDRDKNSSLFLPSTSGTSTFKNDLKNPNTKRALFISPSKNSPIKKSPFRRSPFKCLDLGVDKKRKRSDSEDLHPSKMLKSVVMDIRPCESEVKENLSKPTSRVNISLNRSVSGQSGEMSAIHKKKLQWAVYEALRSQNITASHAQFKIYASNLARVTRRFLPNLTNNAPRPEGGTTDRMLRIARHHVYSVVKGKSVDEIINEYVKNRSRNMKPQGYVGIEEFNEKNKETSNKENAVQGQYSRARNMLAIQSLEKKKLEQLGNEDKIERIRKVINFGDDNR